MCRDRRLAFDISRDLNIVKMILNSRIASVFFSVAHLKIALWIYSKPTPQSIQRIYARVCCRLENSFSAMIGEVNLEMPKYLAPLRKKLLLEVTTHAEGDMGGSRGVACSSSRAMPNATRPACAGDTRVGASPSRHVWQHYAEPGLRAATQRHGAPHSLRDSPCLPL